MSQILAPEARNLITDYGGCLFDDVLNVEPNTKRMLETQLELAMVV